LRKEAETFDTLRPGEDMVGLEKAFAAAEQEEYRPGEAKKEAPKVSKESKETKEPKESKRETKKESKKK
jgi:hypothetical protein